MEGQADQSMALPSLAGAWRLDVPAAIVVFLVAGGQLAGLLGVADPIKATTAEALRELAAEGIEAEVIDLRTLRPLDHETILESVRKTNRLVSAEEGWGPMGVGAEIVARVVEHAFDYLDAPVARIGAQNGISPQAESLEKAFLPNAGDIYTAAKGLL